MHGVFRACQVRAVGWTICEMDSWMDREKGRERDGVGVSMHI